MLKGCNNLVYNSLPSPYSVIKSFKKFIYPNVDSSLASTNPYYSICWDKINPAPDKITEYTDETYTFYTCESKCINYSGCE